MTLLAISTLEQHGTTTDVGCEVVFDGCRWGIVEEVTEDGHFLVVDQDGGEWELPRDRIDSITRLAK